MEASPQTGSSPRLQNVCHHGKIPRGRSVFHSLYCIHEGMEFMGSRQGGQFQYVAVPLRPTGNVGLRAIISVPEKERKSTIHRWGGGKFFTAGSPRPSEQGTGVHTRFRVRRRGIHLPPDLESPGRPPPLLRGKKKCGLYWPEKMLPEENQETSGRSGMERCPY